MPLRKPRTPTSDIQCNMKMILVTSFSILNLSSLNVTYVNREGKIFAENNAVRPPFMSEGRTESHEQQFFVK